jgi:PIN domain nuclease of toxin-antitoxin system
VSLLLLDTHLLLWASVWPERLPNAVSETILDVENTIAFSVASIWEVAIKAGRRQQDFPVDPRQFRRGLLEAGYREIPVLGEHALAVLRLPPHHCDPFDRMLVAQAETEGATLLTGDPLLGQYGGAVRLFA